MAITAKLWIYVTTIPVNTTLKLQVGTAGDNWGTTLAANQADFESTFTNEGETKTITGTGWHSFTFDYGWVDVGGTTWFRLRSNGEGNQNNRSLLFNTEDAGSNQPYIEIVDDNTGKLFPFWWMKN